MATTLYVFEISRIAFEGALIPTLASYLQRGRAAVEQFLAACQKYWVIASAMVSVAAAAVGLALGRGAVAGSLSLVVNIVGDIVLAPHFGVTGIALASTLTYVAVAVYVLFALRARLRGCETRMWICQMRTRFDLVHSIQPSVRQLVGFTNSTHNRM